MIIMPTAMRFIQRTTRSPYNGSLALNLHTARKQVRNLLRPATVFEDNASYPLTGNTRNNGAVCFILYRLSCLQVEIGEIL